MTENEISNLFSRLHRANLQLRQTAQLAAIIRQFVGPQRQLVESQ